MVQVFKITQCHVTEVLNLNAFFPYNLITMKAEPPLSCKLLWHSLKLINYVNPLQNYLSDSDGRLYFSGPKLVLFLLHY